jgi:hypothetical protein
MKTAYTFIVTDRVEPNRYLISNTGKIKDLVKNRVIKGRLISKQGRKPYRLVDLWIKKGERVQRSLAQLVAEHFVANPNGYKNIYHKDHNPTNCNAWNLIWISPDIAAWLGTWHKGKRKNTGSPSIKPEKVEDVISFIAKRKKKASKEDGLLFEYYQTRDESKLWQILIYLKSTLESKAKFLVNDEDDIHDLILDSFMYFVTLCQRNLVKNFVCKKLFECLEIFTKHYYTRKCRFTELYETVEFQNGQYMMLNESED